MKELDQNVSEIIGLDRPLDQILGRTRVDQLLDRLLGKTRIDRLLDRLLGRTRIDRRLDRLEGGIFQRACRIWPLVRSYLACRERLRWLALRATPLIGRNSQQRRIQTVGVKSNVATIARQEYFRMIARTACDANAISVNFPNLTLYLRLGQAGSQLRQRPSNAQAEMRQSASDLAPAKAVMPPRLALRPGHAVENTSRL